MDIEEKLKDIIISYIFCLETETVGKPLLNKELSIKVTSNIRSLYRPMYSDCVKLLKKYYTDYATESSLVGILGNYPSYPSSFVEMKSEFKSVYVENTTVIHMTYFYDYIYNLICDENHLFENFIDNILYKKVFELMCEKNSNIYIRAISRILLFNMAMNEKTHVSCSSIFNYIKKILKDIFLFNTVIYIDTDVMYLSDESEIDDILKILNDNKIEMKYSHKTNKLFIDNKKWMEFDNNDNLINYSGIRL